MSENLDYESKRLLEDIGLQLDALMRSKQLTIHDVAKAIKVHPALIKDVLEGRVPDMSIGFLADLFWACGERLIPVFARLKAA